MASRPRYSPSLLASAAGVELARAGAQVDPGGSQRDVHRRPARHRPWTCSARTGRAMRSTHATRPSRHRRGSTPDVDRASKCMSHFATAAIAVPQPGAPPGRAAADGAALVARPTQHVHQRCTTRWPACPTCRCTAAQGRRSASATSKACKLRFQRATCRARRACTTPTTGGSRRRIPTAALSEPVKPIVYWIDRSVPTSSYRATITAGILEWNKAFEKIGFKNAIRVEVQPDSTPTGTRSTSATPRCAG